jgi:hypothetical protein
MTPNPATMTVQEAIEFAATHAGWTKQTRDVRGSLHNTSQERDAIEAAWMSQHGFHCTESTGGICTYWTHPTERSVMGSKPPWFQPTLDSAAAAMPSHCKLDTIRLNTPSGCTCSAVDVDREDVFYATGETELLARWRLVVACMLAEKEGSNGEQ